MSPDDLIELNQLLNEQKQALAHYQASELYQLEARYTLFHLERLLRNSNNTGLERSLTNYLQERWLTIEKSAIQYMYDLDNPANVLCVALAKKLACSRKPFLYRLMPTLFRAPSSASISSSAEDNDLNLRHLCFDESQRGILFIPEILEYAESSGKLHHSSLFNGRCKPLSTTEVETLQQKHPSITDYLNAIQQKLEFEQQQETLGLRLTKLIKGLRDGSIKNRAGGATEYSEGLDADLAILEFEHYLDTLSEEKRQLLLQTSILTNQADLTFSLYWQRLTRADHIARYQNGEEVLNVGENLSTVYCMSMVANDLDDLLKDPYNKQLLFNTMSYEQYDNPDYQRLQQQLTDCKQLCLASLNSLQRFEYSETEETQQRVAYRLFTRLASDSDFKLTRADKHLAKNWYERIDTKAEPTFASALQLIANRKIDPHVADASFFLPAAKRKKTSTKPTDSLSPSLDR